MALGAVDDLVIAALRRAGRRDLVLPDRFAGNMYMPGGVRPQEGDRDILQRLERIAIQRHIRQLHRQRRLGVIHYDDILLGWVIEHDVAFQRILPERGGEFLVFKVLQPPALVRRRIRHDADPPVEQIADGRLFKELFQRDLIVFQRFAQIDDERVAVERAPIADIRRQRKRHPDGFRISVAVVMAANVAHAADRPACAIIEIILVVMLENGRGIDRLRKLPVMAERVDRNGSRLRAERLVFKFGGVHGLARLLAGGSLGLLRSRLDRLSLGQGGVGEARAGGRHGTQILRPVKHSGVPIGIQRVDVGHRLRLRCKCFAFKLRGIRRLSLFIDRRLFGDGGGGVHGLRLDMGRVVSANAGRCHGAKILRPGIGRLAPGMAEGRRLDGLRLLLKYLRIVLEGSRGIDGLSGLRAGGSLYDLRVCTDGLRIVMIGIPQAPLRRRHMEVILRPVVGDLRPVVSQRGDGLKDIAAAVGAQPPLLTIPEAGRRGDDLRLAQGGVVIRIEPQGPLHRLPADLAGNQGEAPGGAGAGCDDRVVIIVPGMLAGSGNGSVDLRAAFRAGIPLYAIVAAGGLLDDLVLLAPGVVVGIHRKDRMHHKLTAVEAVMAVVPLGRTGGVLMGKNAAGGVPAVGRDDLTDLQHDAAVVTDQIAGIALLAAGLLRFVVERCVHMVFRVDLDDRGLLRAAPQAPVPHHALRGAGGIADDIIEPVVVVRVDGQGLAAHQAAQRTGLARRAGGRAGRRDHARFVGHPFVLVPIGGGGHIVRRHDEIILHHGAVVQQPDQLLVLPRRQHRARRRRADLHRRGDRGIADPGDIRKAQRIPAVYRHITVWHRVIQRQLRAIVVLILAPDERVAVPLDAFRHVVVERIARAHPGVCLLTVVCDPCDFVGLACEGGIDIHIPGGHDGVVRVRDPGPVLQRPEIEGIAFLHGGLFRQDDPVSVADLRGRELLVVVHPVDGELYRRQQTHHDHVVRLGRQHILRQRRKPLQIAS